MYVTIQLSLYQVHPGTDLVVQRLHMLQQVQLTLGLRRWTRLRRACLSVCVLAAVSVCVVLLFNGGCVCVCHNVCVCRGISWFLVDIFGRYFL